jgi:hypothetical protein
MTNGWPAPASQELGANWVGVTARERVEGQFNQELKRLKTWPATARRFRSGTVDEHARVSRSALLSRIEGGSRGRPAIRLRIFDFQLPIAN